MNFTTLDSIIGFCLITWYIDTNNEDAIDQ